MMIDEEISIHQHPKLLSAIEKIDQEKYDEAIADLNQLLIEEPNHPDANLQLAQVYLKQGENMEAAEAYPHANEAMKAAHIAGNLYLDELNQPEKALALFQSVKELCTIYPKWQANIEEGIKKATEKLKKKF